MDFQVPHEVSFKYWISHNNSSPHILFFPQLQDDALFKPSGGKLGENDMDYDTDNKTMATLRRQLRRAHEEYYRRKRYDTVDHHKLIAFIPCFLIKKKGSHLFMSTVLNFIFYFCSDYLNCVMKALELEDTIRNYEQRGASGW